MKSAEEIASIHRLYQDGLSKRKIAAKLGMSRNTVDRYLHSPPTESSRSTTNLGPRSLSRDNQHGLTTSRDQVKEPGDSVGDTAWRVGPYLLSASGELSLGDSRIGMAETQTLILLILAKKANQIVSRDELAQQLWPTRPLNANLRRNVTLSVHRLREVFAFGPLGGNVIRGVYGKGYTLGAAVEPCPTLTPRKRSPGQPRGDAMMKNPFYGEVHDYWANRDPYKLPRQEWLLQQSVRFDPSFEQGYLELCYFQILQCFWGMRASQDVLPQLQRLLEIVDQFTHQPSGWLGIKAEVQSLLLWQPLTAQSLYGTWLADTLPRGMPLFSWARHLIFTGRPRAAIDLLKAQVNDELCQGWLVLAMAYCAIGDLPAAEEAIQRQLSLDSTMIGTRLFLALLMARRGQGAQATRHVLDSGILDRPFEGVQALAAYTLAQGTHHQRAQDLLDEAMARMHQNPSQTGALGYWGLAALALDRDMEAIHCLKLSVRNRCYSAPVLLATPFLKPYAKSPAYRVFAEKMRRSFPILSSAKS
ncbi:MAG: winged helix-turn-helix domain-containing protein [Cyanobacteriota bacterium]